MAFVWNVGLAWLALVEAHWSCCLGSYMWPEKFRFFGVEEPGRREGKDVEPWISGWCLVMSKWAIKWQFFLHDEQMSGWILWRLMIHDVAESWWRSFFFFTHRIIAYIKVTTESTSEDVDVSENRGTPKSSILIGFSTINHLFWGTPIFGNTHVVFEAKVNKHARNAKVSMVSFSNLVSSKYTSFWFHIV